jgi:dTDP-4-amino-4,6-dideoxygalactose transaminase
MQIPIFNLKVTDPKLKEELVVAFEKVISHGKLILGPEVEEFEEKVAKYIGTKYAVGVDSGSSALYLSLRACGIGIGDEVITTPLTWIITINAIAACGAIPVFADVQDDFNIDPISIEEKITSNTKAIVPMHYAGHMCDMPSICAIAEKNNLIIIEDAAQAFGGMLNGKKAGSFSLAAGLSMNPMKVYGGYGEAGAVVTNDSKIYQKIKRLRHAGTTSDPQKIITNICTDISLNHKMDTINAALLLVALKYLPEKLVCRKLIADRYDNELPLQIGRQGSLEGEINARYVYAIKYKERNKLKDYLAKHNVETKIMHEPLACDAPVFRKYNVNPVPNARKILKNSLVIPSHEKMDKLQVNRIIDLTHRFIDTLQT